ncbi:MAG TPA: hypothetical protein VHR45_16235 [Thermoanaerobaculia bacterium]|nr:hypothetical protein [Thermoanaerobaculia bacterium]
MEHAIELPEGPEEALRAVDRAAGEWGAEFRVEGHGGHLALPVVAGLRRGLLSGPLIVEPLAAGSRIVFRPDQSIYYLHTSAIAVLLLACGGCLLAVLWPLFPRLLPLAPFGVVLALSGWLLVASRLRSSGPLEFLRSVAAPDEGGAP